MPSVITSPDPTTIDNLTGPVERQTHAAIAPARLGLIPRQAPISEANSVEPAAAQIATDIVDTRHRRRNDLISPAATDPLAKAHATAAVQLDPEAVAVAAGFRDVHGQPPIGELDLPVAFSAKSIPRGCNAALRLVPRGISSAATDPSPVPHLTAAVDFKPNAIAVTACFRDVNRQAAIREGDLAEAIPLKSAPDFRERGLLRRCRVCGAATTDPPAVPHLSATIDFEPNAIAVPACLCDVNRQAAIRERDLAETVALQPPANFRQPDTTASVRADARIDAGVILRKRVVRTASGEPCEPDDPAGPRHGSRGDRHAHCSTRGAGARPLRTRSPVNFVPHPRPFPPTAPRPAVCAPCTDVQQCCASSNRVLAMTCDQHKTRAAKRLRGRSEIRWRTTQPASGRRLHASERLCRTGENTSRRLHAARLKLI
ncbi:MAG: hypothetical protein AAGK78_06275 [Planctomycetota bacterium]